MEKNVRCLGWCVYLIENKYGHLYCGISNDVQSRVAQHQSDSAKTAKALRGKGPLTLKFVAAVTDKSQALKCESWLKKQPRHYKLALIHRNVELPFDNVVFSIPVVSSVTLSD